MLSQTAFHEHTTLFLDSFQFGTEINVLFFLLHSLQAKVFSIILVWHGLLVYVAVLVVSVTLLIVGMSPYGNSDL